MEMVLKTFQTLLPPNHLPSQLVSWLLLFCTAPLLYSVPVYLDFNKSFLAR